MSTLLQDLRFSLRMFKKHPGLLAVVVLSLGLGIGVNTTMFSLINAVILRPLAAVEEPNSLVDLYTSSEGLEFGAVSYRDYVDYRDRNQVFSGVISQGLVLISLSNSGQNEIVPGALVSGDYFSVLGVKPALGRGFLPDEDKSPGAVPVAVISHGLWKMRFASDPGLVGRNVTLNGRNFTVVGIAPAGFSGSSVGVAPSIWVPMMMQAQMAPGEDRLNDRGWRWLEVTARLKPGVTREQAQAAMAPLISQLSQEYPTTNDGTELTIVPKGAGSEVRSILSPVLTLLMVVVVLVLLIACFNIANLLLARATARQKEIGIRLAMGATRSRLIRQLLTESVLLALIGGVVGLLLAYGTTRLMQAFKPPTSYPLMFDLSLDGFVLGFTFLLSVLTGIIFGLVPAFQTTRPALVPVLKDESAFQGYSKFRLRNILVIAQIAVSLVLLISAGLFIRSLRNARSTNHGFQTDNLLIASMDVGLQGYEESKGRNFYHQLLERIQRVPGVSAASLVQLVPLGGDTQQIGVTVEGYEAQRDEKMSIDFNTVAPRYFETVGIPLLQGRDFSSQDRAETPGVVIVNETFARRFWPGQTPLGKRLSLGRPRRFLEVIGVAKTANYNSLREDPLPFLYLPVEQRYVSGLTLYVRTTGDPANAISTVRREVQALEPDLPIYRLMTMNEHMGVALVEQRVAAVLLGVFGLLALVLASVGLYGVMAYSVSQRTRELGIRMALGARSGNILELVMRQGLLLTLIGLAIGLVLAFGLTRFLAAQLYGVGATDPLTFGLTALLLTCVAMLATFVPAWKAIRVNPVIALRNQ